MGREIRREQTSRFYIRRSSTDRIINGFMNYQCRISESIFFSIYRQDRMCARDRNGSLRNEIENGRENKFDIVVWAVSDPCPGLGSLCHAISA